MKTWLAEATNPKYEGKTLGVPFQNGKAVISDATIDKTLGLKAAQIVKRLETDFNVTDPETGKRTFLRELSPADRAGAVEISEISFSADEKSYAYATSRVAGTLYAVEGAR